MKEIRATFRRQKDARAAWRTLFAHDIDLRPWRGPAVYDPRALIYTGDPAVAEPAVELLREHFSDSVRIRSRKPRER